LPVVRMFLITEPRFRVLLMPLTLRSLFT
jgi:hypothetical protein